MTRSTFLKSTIAATGIVTGTQTVSNAQVADGNASEYVEIRKYKLKSAEKQAVLEAYLKDAAIPALNRLGRAAACVARFLRKEHRTAF